MRSLHIFAPMQNQPALLDVTEARQTHSRLRSALWPIALLPIALAAYLLFTYQVDLPRWDEVVIGNFLPARHDFSRISFASLLQQSNESRLVFPKLISVSIALATNWDTRYTMWLALALMLANVWLLLKIFQRTAPAPLSATASPLLFAAMALVL